MFFLPSPKGTTCVISSIPAFPHPKLLLSRSIVTVPNLNGPPKKKFHRKPLPTKCGSTAILRLFLNRSRALVNKERSVASLKRLPQQYPCFVTTSCEGFTKSSYTASSGRIAPIETKLSYDCQKTAMTGWTSMYTPC